jgi:hypothetical protein
MLIAKGYDVGFVLERNRSIVTAPRSYAMLHDPSGSSWPKSSVLVAPFSKNSAAPSIKNTLAKQYFRYEPRGGEITLPDRDIRSWKEIGPIKEIDYWRPGDDRELKGDWWHPFGEAGFLFKSHLPILFRQGRLMRLELGRSTLNWRGFVYP